MFTDSIENNVEKAYDNVEAGAEQLSTAAMYQVGYSHVVIHILLYKNVILLHKNHILLSDLA